MILRAAKVNNKLVPEHLLVISNNLNEFGEQVQDEPSENIISIIRSPLLCKRLFILFLGWYVKWSNSSLNKIISYIQRLRRISSSLWQDDSHHVVLRPYLLFGELIRQFLCQLWTNYVSFNMKDGDDQHFINDKLCFSFYRFVEIPGSILGIYMMDKIGRRVTISGSMLLSGIACLSAGLLPTGNLAIIGYKKQNHWISTQGNLSHLLRLSRSGNPSHRTVPIGQAIHLVLFFRHLFLHLWTVPYSRKRCSYRTLLNIRQNWRNHGSYYCWFSNFKISRWKIQTWITLLKY